MKSVMNSEVGYLYVKDGRDIHISKSDVAAIEIVPLVKCQHCEKWVIPQKVEERYNDIISYTIEHGCPECGAEM